MDSVGYKAGSPYLHGACILEGTDNENRYIGDGGLYGTSCRPKMTPGTRDQEAVGLL